MGMGLQEYYQTIVEMGATPEKVQNHRNAVSAAKQCAAGAANLPSSRERMLAQVRCMKAWKHGAGGAKSSPF